MQAAMLTTLSPKFQMVVPKAVRQALSLVAGQKIEFQLNPAGRYEILPQLPMSFARGMFPSIDTQIENDPEGSDWPGGCPPLSTLT